MLALYMDHNVPRAITEGLRLRGIDVITAYEDSADDMNDPALLDRATELGRALFTQVDVVFEKDGKRFLETFPKNLLTPVADIFQRYQNNEPDHPTDFFLKQLAYQYKQEETRR